MDVLNPRQKRIGQPTEEITDKLLWQKIFLCGIAPLCTTSCRWLRNYINHKCNSTLKQISVNI